MQILKNAPQGCIFLFWWEWVECNSHSLYSWAPFTSLRCVPNQTTSLYGRIHKTHPMQNKKRTTRVHFLFWWEWVESNHLSQRQQIYSLPRLSDSGARPEPQFVVRAEGIRTYKNTMSCVISNELMFASQGYPIHTLPATSLVRAEGIEPSFQAWKACILAFELCSQQFSKPSDYNLFFYKRKYLFVDFDTVYVFA